MKARRGCYVVVHENGLESAADVCCFESNTAGCSKKHDTPAPKSWSYSNVWVTDEFVRFVICAWNMHSETYDGCLIVSCLSGTVGLPGLQAMGAWICVSTWMCVNLEQAPLVQKCMRGVWG